MTRAVTRRRALAPRPDTRGPSAYNPLLPQRGVPVRASGQPRRPDDAIVNVGAPAHVSDGVVMFVLPVKTVSEKNAREHWAPKAKRVKAQRIGASILTHALCGYADADRPTVRFVHVDPIEVTLTRISPRKLDDDNLQRSLSAIRDGVADAICKDCNDRDPRVTWRYGEEYGGVGVYGVRVRIESVAADNGAEGQRDP